MSDEDPGFDEDELAIHRLFSVLRDEVARVSARFTSRVAERVQVAEIQTEGPAPGGVVTSVLVEALNMLAAALGSTSSTEDDSDGK